MKRWAVGNVRTGHEIPMAERITELGAEVYCPVATRMTRQSGKRCRTEVQEGALPGYLFVNPDTIDEPDEIYRHDWFHYFIVDINRRLLKINDEDLEGLRDRERLGGFRERFFSGPVFAIGETVKVPDGPWKSMRGQVVAVNRGRYCLDNLDFMRPVWFSGLTLLGKSA